MYLHRIIIVHAIISKLISPLNFPAHSESFSNGQSVDLAAPVGLLTRNIKIIGGNDHETLLTENYGTRVLVGLLSTKDQTYTGMTI